MDIAQCILVWLIGFITGVAAAGIANRSYLKQCLAALDHAKKLRDETTQNLDKIAALGKDITNRHAEMLKMADSIRKFHEAVNKTPKPPDWDQEKKKLPDQL